MARFITVGARREPPHRQARNHGLTPTLRALVRARELWFVALATLVGVVAGGVVTAMRATTQALHVLLFAIEPGTLLSAAAHIAPWRALLMPVAGGVVLGLIALLLARWRPRTAVDPIEANALHGGRLSLADSILVALQTMVSNGFGGSVGLEAGYAQMGSGLASRLGSVLRLRRNDLRVLVGCGAAGAMAAAFNAPFTGAFYGFELIIGIYSVATVAPVMAASVAAVVTANGLGGNANPITIFITPHFHIVDYGLFIALGVLCGVIGIGVMRLVTLIEAIFRQLGLPSWAKPVVGGALLGLLALLSPRVLSSGHGALHVVLDQRSALWPLLGLIVLKIAASAVSLGSGFRGGLFFASLFLGSLVGRAFAAAAVLAVPSLGMDPAIPAVVGMGALAVAVVGGPLTMSFLALETTGDLLITGVVLTASIVSALTVRELFGYSFSTWRLHLRGETIRSAQDIGWLRSLTVGRMMRRGIRTVRTDMALAEFRRQYPLGSTQRMVAVDGEDRYAGIILTADAHAAELDATVKSLRVADLLRYRDAFLLPAMNAKQAAALFDRNESEALAVVDNVDDPRVLGLLTEAHLLRRYAEELEKVRRNLAGES